MFERFTEPARRVVEESVRVAQSQQAAEVRPEHLLAALLDERETLAVMALSSLGSSAERLRDLLGQQSGKYLDGLDEDDAQALKLFGIDLDAVVRRIDSSASDPSARARRPRFSRASKKALELSLREAISLRHSYIGTEHLLLGLVRCDDRVVGDTMHAGGVDRAVLRQAVADAVRQAS
jgi:ATP-dependent Clp protease ATP-binding subunit ClpA